MVIERELADGQLKVEFRLWDVFAGEQMTGLVYKTTPANWRRIAHIISDAIYQRLTGEDGYFDTRVVYVSETGPADRRVLVELYHPTAEVEVTPGAVEGRFTVAAMGGAAPQKLTKEATSAAWLEQLPSAEIRRLFEHLRRPRDVSLAEEQFRSASRVLRVEGAVPEEPLEVVAGHVHLALKLGDTREFQLHHVAVGVHDDGCFELARELGIAHRRHVVAGLKRLEAALDHPRGHVAVDVAARPLEIVAQLHALLLRNIDLVDRVDVAALHQLDGVFARLDTHS